MGLNSTLRFFLPTDDKFIPYLQQAADNLKVAAKVYSSLAKAANRDDLTRLRDEIKRLEHVGDDLTHKIFEELNRSFITPFDREDIYELTKSMDDVLDLMDQVADILVLYQFDRVDEQMALLLDVTERAVIDIHKGVSGLKTMDYDSIREQIVSVHALENEGDRLHHLFVGKLFAEEKDAIRLLKFSTLYTELEHTIDTCEDLMNAIESIMLKQA